MALCLLALSSAGLAQALAVGNFVPGQVVAEPAPGTTIADINTAYGTTTLERIPNTNIYLLKLPADSGGVGKVVEDMADDPRLLYAEPNFLGEASEGGVVEGGARHKAWGVSPSETNLEQYPRDKLDEALNLSSAHEITRGEGTTIAVLDTGAQLDHQDLDENFEGVARYDFVGKDKNPSDRRVGKDVDRDGTKDEMWGHGTHVAGIVDLVAPAAKIMPLRVLDTEGYGTSFTIARAIYYAERNGADVINLSLGGPQHSKTMENAVDYAVGKGAVVAAAAGNSNSLLFHYPAAGNGIAASEGLVAVTSVDRYEKKSDFANYGTWVDIAAPGEGIRSAFPGNKDNPYGRYANWSGTSMATPFVSGQAALIHKVDCSLDPAGIEQRVRSSARPLDLKNPDYLGMLGAGHADVGASLEGLERVACF